MRLDRDLTARVHRRARLRVGRFRRGSGVPRGSQGGSRVSGVRRGCRSTLRKQGKKMVAVASPIVLSNCSFSLLDSGGFGLQIPAREWVMWLGKGSCSISDDRGSSWCAQNEGRRAAYIGSSWSCGRSRVTNGEVMLRPAKGMGEGGALFTASRRSSRASLCSDRWSSTVARLTRASSSPSTVIVVRDCYWSSAATWACLVASRGHDEALGGL